jgi:hypothetical protein
MGGSMSFETGGIGALAQPARSSNTITGSSNLILMSTPWKKKRNRFLTIPPRAYHLTISGAIFFMLTQQEKYPNSSSVLADVRTLLDPAERWPFIYLFKIVRETVC